MERGNSNLYSAPHVVNPDGSVSTVRSMSFQDDDGQEVLIPTVDIHGGGILTDEQAIEQFRRTGKHLGKYASPGLATGMADIIHKAFAAGKYDVPLASSHRVVSPDQLERVLLQRMREGQ